MPVRQVTHQSLSSSEALQHARKAPRHSRKSTHDAERHDNPRQRTCHAQSRTYTFRTRHRFHRYNLHRYKGLGSTTDLIDLPPSQFSSFQRAETCDPLRNHESALCGAHLMLSDFPDWKCAPLSEMLYFVHVLSRGAADLTWSKGASRLRQEGPTASGRHGSAWPPWGTPRRPACPALASSQRGWLRRFGPRRPVR